MKIKLDTESKFDVGDVITPKAAVCYPHRQRLMMVTSVYVVIDPDDGPPLMMYAVSEFPTEGVDSARRVSHHVFDQEMVKYVPKEDDSK